MSDILASIFSAGDQIKRNLRDAYKDPVGYLEGAVIENHKNWKKKPDEMSMGFFNPVPLGTMGNFVLRKAIEDGVTNLSRRDFLKKSAGLAGGTAAASIPGAKLLQKFAPEEKEIAAKAIPKEWASVEGGAYRYHSLKDYLDDVRYGADDASAEIYNGTMIQHNNLGDPFVVEGNHEVAMKAAKDFENSIIRDRLLRDEEAYNTAKFFYKDNLKDPTTGKWIDPFTGKPHSEEFLRNIRNNIEDFSPQAKKEMKALKEYVNEMNTGKQPRPEGTGIYQNRDWADPKNIERYIMLGMP